MEGESSTKPEDLCDGLQGATPLTCEGECEVGADVVSDASKTSEDAAEKIADEDGRVEEPCATEANLVDSVPVSYPIQKSVSKRRNEALPEVVTKSRVFGAKRSANGAGKCAAEKSSKGRQVSRQDASQAAATKIRNVPLLSPRWTKLRIEQCQAIYGGSLNTSQKGMCSSHRRKVAWDSSLDYTHVDEKRLPAASRAASLETQLSQYLYPFLDRSGSGNSKGGDVGHSAAAGARKSGSLKMKKKVKQATPDATELPRPSDRPSPNFDHHREECPPQTGSPANHDNETNEDDNMQPTRPEACEASTVSHFRKSSITSQLQYGTCGGDDDLQHCAQLLLERCNGSSTRPPLGFSYKCVDTGRYMPHLMVGSLPPSRGSRASRKGKHYTALVSASHNRISISPGSRASERTGTTSSGLKNPRNAGQPEPATEKLTPISPSQGLEEEDTAVPHSAAGQSSGSSDTTSTNTLYVCEAEEGALDTKQTLPSGPPDVKAEEPATPTEAERSGTTCESGMEDAKSGAREEPVIRETGERAGDPHEETSEKTEEKVDEEKDPNEELSEAEESGEECVTDGEITESAPEEVATGG